MPAYAAIDKSQRRTTPSHTLVATNTEVRSIAIFCTGIHLSAGHRCGKVNVWAIATGTNNCHSPDMAISALSPSAPNGKQLASTAGEWSCGDTLEIHNLTDGSATAQTGEVASVAFSPDGKSVTASAADKSVRIRHVSGYQER